MRFGGFFKARIGLVFWSFSFVDGSVMPLISVDIVIVTEILVFTNISVRMPSNENDSNTFSQRQLEEIKGTVLS